MSAWNSLSFRSHNWNLIPKFSKFSNCSHLDLMRFVGYLQLDTADPLPAPENLHILLKTQISHSVEAKGEGGICEEIEVPLESLKGPLWSALGRLWPHFHYYSFEFCSKGLFAVCKYAFFFFLLAFAYAIPLIRTLFTYPPTHLLINSFRCLLSTIYESGIPFPSTWE